MSLLSWLLTAALIVLWVISYSNQQAANLLHKIYLLIFGIFNLFLTRDGKWPKQPDPDQIKDITPLASKRIIVLRHGESAWNEVFNKGLGGSFPVRLVKGLLKELRLLPTTDSVFFDSPLNHEGVEQSRGVAKFLQNPGESALSNPDIASVIETLRGLGSERSVIVCSNLRRCIETTVIALYDRLMRTGEKIAVLSNLQEISRNIDCIALGPPQELPNLHVLQKELKEKFTQFDATENKGNKPILGLNGLDRMRDFCDWAYQRDEPVIIAGGHSLYWRHFFKTYLPGTADLKPKTEKIQNCGIVTFRLQRALVMEGDKQRIMYRIDPSSVLPVYLGFTEPKKKK